MMHHALKLAEAKRESNDDALQRARELLVRFNLARKNGSDELDDGEFFEFIYLASVFSDVTAQWHPNAGQLSAFLDMLMSERDLGDENKPTQSKVINAAWDLIRKQRPED